eukprot:Sdes_comp20579_c0_seq1m15486
MNANLLSANLHSEAFSQCHSNFENSPQDGLLGSGLNSSQRSNIGFDSSRGFGPRDNLNSYQMPPSSNRERLAIYTHSQQKFSSDTLELHKSRTAISNYRGILDGFIDRFTQTSACFSDFKEAIQNGQFTSSICSGLMSNSDYLFSSPILL